MADVKFDERFAPAEATRGSWVPIDGSTISGGLPSGSRGRYAQLSYIIGSEPGALSISLSGGNVILPVSSVNLDEPLAVENTVGQDFIVTQNLPDTTVYSSVSVPATSIETVNFASNITLLEIYNNDTTLPVYVGFNNVSLPTLSAQALPVVAEGFYSISRTTSAVFIGNVNSSSTVDIRIVGHRKA